MKDIIKTKLPCPVIAGVQITTDKQGRYNLNALHKASGLGEEKAPAKWSRSKQARELLLDKAQHSDKQVPSFRYNVTGVKAIKLCMGA